MKQTQKLFKPKGKQFKSAREWVLIVTIHYTYVDYQKNTCTLKINTNEITGILLVTYLYYNTTNSSVFFDFKFASGGLTY